MYRFQRRTPAPLCAWARRSLYVLAPLAGLLFFWPHGATLHRVNLEIWLWLRIRVGVPRYVTPEWVEQILNFAVFFVIWGCVRLAVPSVRAVRLVIFGIVAALGIELVQLSWLPERSFDWFDFIFTGVGGMSGVILSECLLSGKPSDSGVKDDPHNGIC